MKISNGLLLAIGTLMTIASCENRNTISKDLEVADTTLIRCDYVINTDSVDFYSFKETVEDELNKEELRSMAIDRLENKVDSLYSLFLCQLKETLSDSAKAHLTITFYEQLKISSETYKNNLSNKAQLIDYSYGTASANGERAVFPDNFYKLELIRHYKYLINVFAHSRNDFVINE